MCFGQSSDVSDDADLLPSRDIGLAFYLVCDRGFAVGVCTHKHARLGHLIWLAEPFFDDEPSMATAEAIGDWRWPVFYPLGAAVRRRLVTRLGRLELPPELADFPKMRSGGGAQPWMEFQHSLALGPTTTDRTLPIAMIVNHEMLKEMLVTDWQPSARW